MRIKLILQEAVDIIKQVEYKKQTKENRFCFVFCCHCVQKLLALWDSN